jgi:hypothetical protein
MGKMGVPLFLSLQRQCGGGCFLLLVIATTLAASFVADDTRGYLSPARARRCSSSVRSGFPYSMDFASISYSGCSSGNNNNNDNHDGVPQPFETAEDTRLASSFMASSSRGCTRRGALVRGSVAATGTVAGLLLGILPLAPPPPAAAAGAGAGASITATTSLEGARAALVEARNQLDPIPGYIRDEKWDLVRAALLRRPLNDLWSKASANVVSSYAEALGDAGGDELEALELREALSSHLRYLDMAVYNNVFNPIATQGTIGASADLVKSYYDDPTREYTASLSALQELIGLSDRLVVVAVPPQQKQ